MMRTRKTHTYEPPLVRLGKRPIFFCHRIVVPKLKIEWVKKGEKKLHGRVKSDWEEVEGDDEDEEEEEEESRKKN